MRSIVVTAAWRGVSLAVRASCSSVRGRGRGLRRVGETASTVGSSGFAFVRFRRGRGALGACSALWGRYGLRAPRRRGADAASGFRLPGGAFLGPAPLPSGEPCGGAGGGVAVCAGRGPRGFGAYGGGARRVDVGHVGQRGFGTVPLHDQANGVNGVGGVTGTGQPDGGSDRLWPPTGPTGPAGSAESVGSVGPVRPMGSVGVPGRDGAPGAAGEGDLQHHRRPWLRAAEGADHLVTLLGPVRADLDAAHRGVVAGGGALSALAELGVVRASWERRIDQARGECGSLAGNFREAVRAQSRSNEAVRSGFDAVGTPAAVSAGTAAAAASGTPGDGGVR